jgi:hypothetical protein
VQTHGQTRYYALAARRVRSGPESGNPIVVPREYELDDVALAVMWVVADLDTALLDDDAALAVSSERLQQSFESQAASAVGRDLNIELSAASQMWLGSNFCAGHVLRHTDSLSATPTFWTTERTGEEASTWLVFAHKFVYLRETAALFGHRDPPPTRVFCVPPDAVVASPRPERILLLLAIALMESFGIHAVVSAEPDHPVMPGFVIGGTDCAIVANWSGEEAIWQVDVTDRRGVVHEFTDAGRYVVDTAITPVSGPYERLRVLADYLDLEWSWLVARCRALAEQGLAGLAQPRSRLLSLAGLERACRFLGSATGENR